MVICTSETILCGIENSFCDRSKHQVAAHLLLTGSSRTTVSLDYSQKSLEDSTTSIDLLDCQSYIILYCKKSRCETSIDWKKLPRSTYNNKRWFLGLPRFVLRDRTQLRNAFKIHTQLVLHRIVTVIVIYIVTWERSNQWLSKPYQEQHNNKRWSVVIVKVV